jgi:hypothetical protein
MSARSLGLPLPSRAHPPRPVIAPTPVGATLIVAPTPRRATIKVARWLRLQAREACVCACTPPSMILAFPGLPYAGQTPSQFRTRSFITTPVPPRTQAPSPHPPPIPASAPQAQTGSGTGTRNGAMIGAETALKPSRIRSEAVGKGLEEALSPLEGWRSTDRQPLPSAAFPVHYSGPRHDQEAP